MKSRSVLLEVVVRIALSRMNTLGRLYLESRERLPKNMFSFSRIYDRVILEKAID